MRILCIGDSNTWGYNPVNGFRHASRWTKVLQQMMPENEIVEEGMNGRTLLSVDPFMKERCGIAGLKMLLMSHKPIDLVVVMLGTNELKTSFECSAKYVAKGIEEFIKVIKDKEMWDRFSVPKLLVVSPVLIREELIVNGDAFGGYDEKSVRESKHMAEEIKFICEKYDVDFMNAADYAKASLFDNIHMDEENHGKLAVAICGKIREINLHDTIKRVQLMEQYFDDVQDLLKGEPKLCCENTKFQENMKILTKYYEGGQWLKDYECDERGELPGNLKRGILSEDGFYNFLVKFEEKILSK